MLKFPTIHVGNPICYESLSIFPLQAGLESKAQYVLADEGLASGTVTVEELSEAGSVPELFVHNQADSFVLFLEGEELAGAKQNRVLNTSVLVAPKSKIKIPVSCVEQGRWNYRSKLFSSSGGHGSSKMRHILKESVYESTQKGEGHRSDQGKVWHEVSRQMKVLDCSSPTVAMADTYESHKHRIAEYRDQLKYVPDSVGLAVAIGGKLVSVDLFDKPATCQKVWDRLLSGLIMEALETSASAAAVTKTETEQLVAKLHDCAWQQSPAAGAGAEYRYGAKHLHASALVHDGAVVHGSLTLAE